MRSQTNFLKKVVEIWVFYATTLFLIGYFIFPASKKHNLILNFGVCVPVVLLIPFYYKKISFSNWVVVSTIVFAVYLFLTTCWAIDYSFYQSVKYFQYFLVLCCLIVSIFFVHYKQPSYSEYIIKAFIIVGVLHYIYSILGYYHTFSNPLEERYNKFRAIDEATYAGMLFLACIWLIIEQKKLFHKLIIFTLSIPFIIVLVIAKSRGPQLAFLASFILLGYLKGIRLKNTFVITIIFLSVFLFLLFLTDTAKQIFNRGLEFPYRLQIWSISIHEGLEHFWFGRGGSLNDPIFVDGVKFNHSHNILLSVFRMGGVIGVLLFLINLFLCFAAGFKQQDSITKLWVVWLFFGVLCLMTNGRYPLSKPTDQWFAYWIPIAFICATTPFFKIAKCKY